MDIAKAGWVGAHSGMSHAGKMMGDKHTGGKKNPKKMKEKGPKQILNADPMGGLTDVPGVAGISK